MNQKKKAAGLDALTQAGSLSETAPLTETTLPSAAKKTKSFPLHLPLAVHESLREIAFHERISMTQLILQGVDTVLKQRGLKGVAELKNTS